MDTCLSPMGAREVAVARRQIEIDRDKLRAAIRKLPDEYLFYMLDDAIDQLPRANLRTIVGKVPRSAAPAPRQRAGEEGEPACRRDSLRDGQPGWRLLRVLRRQFQELHGEVQGHDGLDRRVSPAPRSLRGTGEDSRPGRGVPGLRHHLRSPGPYRRVPARHNFLRRRGGGLAGRGPLGEGAAAVVQSPVGDGRT